MLHGVARGVEFGLGAGIVGAARLEDRHQIGHRCLRTGLAVLRHRPEIALRHHAAHMIFGPRLDPNGVGAAQQQRVGLGIRDDAAGGGDDRGLMRGDDTIERAALLAAERSGAGHLDQVGNAGAVILLDDAIELDEGPAEMLREHPPERRLAGAAQPDQRNAPGAIGAAGKRDPRFDQLGQLRQFAFRHLRQQIEDAAQRRRARAGLGQQGRSRKIERLRNGAQHARRWIAGPAFDLRQISFGGFRGLRQLPPRHAALGAIAAHFAPDRGEECCDGGASVQ